jgi:hypothetical protein
LQSRISEIILPSQLANICTLTVTSRIYLLRWQRWLFIGRGKRTTRDDDCKKEKQLSFYTFHAVKIDLHKKASYVASNYFYPEKRWKVNWWYLQNLSITAKFS